MTTEINIPNTYSQLEGKHKRMDTEVNLNEDYKLTLTTYKNLGGCLMTYAYVSKRSPTRGAGDAFLYCHRIAGDFHRVLKTSPRRVTANAVMEQHGEYLKDLAGLIVDAKRYYHGVFDMGGPFATEGVSEGVQSV